MSAGAKIRVLLAEVQNLLRLGLVDLLDMAPDIEVAGETADAGQVVALVKRVKPDVLVLALSGPDFSGLEVLRCLADAGERVLTLVLASADEKEQVAEAFKLGSRGVVFRDSATKVLMQGIRALCVDSCYWIGSVAVKQPGRELRRLTERVAAGGGSPAFGLTKREREVTSAIVSGYSNKEIARRFSISEDTVKHHVTNIFDKVGVYNRLELALFAIHHGLVGRP